MRQKLWQAVSTAAGIAGGMAARRVIASLWGRVSDLDPPVNPADRRITWRDALAWGVAAGVGAGIARVVGRRLAAKAWHMTAGEAPPGIA